LYCLATILLLKISGHYWLGILLGIPIVVWLFRREGLEACRRNQRKEVVMRGAVRRTYEPGQFSQVNLPDGTKVLVSIGSTDIRVVKLGFLNIPAGEVWTFEFGFPLRINLSRTSEQATRVLDATLAVVEGCLTIDEVQQKLSADGARLLACAVGPEGAPREKESLAMIEKELLKKMTAGVSTIQMAMFERLCARFERSCHEETAQMLAAAVVNELFFRPPGNQEAADFLRRNYTQVQDEISNLKMDHEIRVAFTQALRVQQAVLHAQGKISSQEMATQMGQRGDMGILIPGGDFPEVEGFLEFAVRFSQSPTRR
jgi:hypothetical protein